MLTSEEIAALEAILNRARADATRAAGRKLETIAPGDIVQLRPGADSTWETSLVLVTQIDSIGRIRGQILQPHRSGCPEAWGTFKLPEVTRIGRAPYPEPPADVKSWCYSPPCPLVIKKTAGSEEIAEVRRAQAQYRIDRAASVAAFRAEQLHFASEDRRAKRKKKA